LSVSVPLLQIVRPCTHPLELPLVDPLLGVKAGCLCLGRRLWNTSIKSKTTCDVNKSPQKDNKTQKKPVFILNQEGLPPPPRSQLSESRSLYITNLHKQIVFF